MDAVKKYIAAVMIIANLAYAAAPAEVRRLFDYVNTKGTMNIAAARTRIGGFGDNLTIDLKFSTTNVNGKMGLEDEEEFHAPNLT